MAIKMDGHAITSLKLKASDGSEVTKQLTEEGTIPIPTATKQISANGTYDVKSFASAEVNVGGDAPTYQEKTITENGTYTPDSGYDAFSKVTVNVSGGGEGELPSEYQKVEWIASDGNQYIDTQYAPTNSTGVKARFLSLSSSSTTEYHICAARTSGVDDRYYTTYVHDGEYRYAWNTAIIPSGSFTAPSYSVTTELNYLNSRKAVAEGVEIGDLTTDYVGTSCPFYIFGVNISNSFNPQYGFIGQLQYLNISEGTSVVRKFVPCYRKSDSVIGLYDIVEGEFYTNAGSGTFTKGANAG